MRMKTEAKRQAILEVAAQAFQELGFERTSMSEICARVGGSKATIYNYFASKEELFSEVIFLSTEAEFMVVHQALEASTDDVAESLQRFGERLLTFHYSPRIRAERHLAISESRRSELGRLVYERGVQRSQNLIAAFMARAMAQGQLRETDARVVAQHFFGLLEAELLEPFLHQQLGEVGAEQIRAVTARAVAVFMAGYGPRAHA